MTGQRNYIEELTERVAAGKQAGQSLGELQKRMTVASLKSLQANGYGDILARVLAGEQPALRPDAAVAERRERQHCRRLQES